MPFAPCEDECGVGASLYECAQHGLSVFLIIIAYLLKFVDGNDVFF